jgi:Cu/Ag efflux pump CusA
MLGRCRNERNRIQDLIAEMDEKLRMPVDHIWTQPIINRIDMLATGIRSQVGIKIFGNDLKSLEDLSRCVAAVVKTVPGAVDVYPERISGAPYIDIKINRTAAARSTPEFRGSPMSLGRIPISSPTGAPISLAQLADIRTVEGPFC